MLMASLALTGGVNAAVLYELPLNTSSGGISRNKVSSQAAENHYSLTKVTVDSPDGWLIDSVAVFNRHNYDFNADGFPPTVLSGAYLQIVPEADLTSFVPGNAADFYTGAEASLTQLAPGSQFAVGYNQTVVNPTDAIFLAPGTYWIGVTPDVNNLSFQFGIQFGTTDASAAGEIAQYAEAGALTATNGSAPTATEEWQTTSGTGLSIVIEGAAVPEPGSAALLGLGALGLILRRRRQ